MLTRRTLLISSAPVLLAAGLVLKSGLAWAAPPAPAEATTFVLALGSKLTSIVNGQGDYDAKKRALQPLIEQAVDIDGIARFCLGRFFRTATPAQQADYLHVFHDVLVNNIGGKIGEFEGVSFRPTTTLQRDNDDLVGTLITRPNQQPNTVQWVVEQVDGRPKVVDVIAEGTSLRLTQRSDYSAYLSRNGNNVDALVAAMKQQVRR